MRPPRAGTIVADIENYLRTQGKATVGELEDALAAMRSARGLPGIKPESVRGALSANTGELGHRLFIRQSRGLYALQGR